MLPFLPLLPATAAAAEAHTACGAANPKIPFAQIAAGRVCLECASPLNRCGCCYFALRRDDAAVDGDAWCVVTEPCTCGACAEYVQSLAGAADSIVAADRRARLAERHNTRLLDEMLGVDEPIALQERFSENRVPVLLLRRMLFGEAGCASSSSLLKSLKLAGYHREKELPFVFCSFARTLEYVQSEPGRQLFCERVLARREELDVSYQIDVPAEIESNGRACMIVVAALLRVVVAYDLRDEVMHDAAHNYTLDSFAQHYELQLQLFADTHLDLLLGAAVRGAHDDATLCEPMSAATAMPAEALASNAPLHEIIRRSVYERCYPHPLRCSSAGEMPDLANALASADLWTKASDNTRSNVTELIHNVFSKTGNHRCGGRNFAKMVCEMMGYNVPTRTFIVNLLELHSLGNYANCGPTFRPGFRTRLAVRRAYSLDELQSEPWCAWCHYAETELCPLPGCDNCNANTRPKAHKQHLCPGCTQFSLVNTKLYAAMREFSVYMTQWNVVVANKLRLDSEWTPFTRVVALAANESRRHMHRMYTSQAAGGAPMTPKSLATQQQAQMAAIELVYQANKSVQRLRKEFMFASLMVRMCNHAHSQIVCQTWSGPQQSEDFLVAPALRDGVEFDDERLERMNVCFQSLPHLGHRRWCDVFTIEYVDAVARVMLNKAGDLVVGLLPMVGVSPGCVAAVQDLHRHSELRNMPDNSLKAACTELARLFPVDFHVIHCLLQRIVRHDQFRVMPLDDRTAIAQIRALRARHKLMPWETLPPIDRLYFCAGENRVYADLIEPLTAELVQVACDDCDGDALLATMAPFGSGPKGALFSNATGMMHCTRPPSSSIGKKFERDGMLAESEFFGESDETATETDKRTAKSVRVQRATQRSCSQPLKFVSMIGKLVRIGSHIYALCVTCGSPFVVASNSFANGGLSCGRHVQVRDAGCYTELREHVTRHSHVIATRAPETDAVPLVDRFVTIDPHDDEVVHVRVSRDLHPLCAPSHVRPKSAPVDKIYCVGTPCFAEKKYRANVSMLAWAAQLGDQKLTTRNIARRFGEETPALMETSEPTTELAELEEQLKEAEDAWTAATKGLDVEMLEWALETTAESELAPGRKKFAPQYAELKPLRALVASMRHMGAAARAAIEAAEAAAKSRGGLGLAEAERLTDEALASGAVLVRVAITCAFCYARCERNSCYTRVNVVDLDHLFVDSLWQRKIEKRGRLDIWLCKKDYDKIKRFLVARPVVNAQDLWDTLVEQKQRADSRKLAFRNK